MKYSVYSKLRNIIRIFKNICADLCYLFKSISMGNKINNYQGCRILLYHSISERHHKYDYMGLSSFPHIFDMHLKYLKENKYNVISLAEFVSIIKNNRNIPENSVVITFDDGYKGIKTYAEAILNRYGFSATVFITVDYIGKEKNVDGYQLNEDFMDWEDIRSFKNIHIGSHGISHRRLNLLNNEEIQKEVRNSKALISKRIQKEISEFSYPHGRFNEAVINSLKNARYVCGCSSINGLNKDTTDPYRLRRVEITAFDDTVYKFKKKLLGCYDWLNFHRSFQKAQFPQYTNII